MTVDVVLPLCAPNGSWLAEAVDSVRRQHHEDWHLLIVGMRSDEEVLRSSRGALDDERIRFVHTSERLSPGRARMLALSRGDGDALAFIDQDDRWAPEKLAAQVAALRARPPVHAVLCGTGAIDARGAPVPSRAPPGWDSERLSSAKLKAIVFLQHEGISLGSSLIRRETFDALGGFSSELRAGEDSEFWVRFVDGGFRFVRLSARLVERRFHRGQASRTSSWRAGHWQAIDRILAHHPDLAPYVERRRRNLRCEEAMCRLHAGETAACRREALGMLRLAPWDVRAWVLLGFSLTPRLGARLVERHLR